jgi:hypothetical protein
MSEYFNDTFKNAKPVAYASGLTPGTLIETMRGPRAIEKLKLGDLIENIDGDLQPLRSLSRQKVRGTGGSAPIRISPGGIGNSETLLVAPMHRVLLTGWQAELYFGQDEVLIEARSLVNGTTVARQEVVQIEYLSLGFDAHQIILAQEALVESDMPHAVGNFNNVVSPRRNAFPSSRLARPTIDSYDAKVLAV